MEQSDVSHRVEMRSLEKAQLKTDGGRSMKILVVDVGGTHVKILATGHRAHRKFSSGPAMTPEQMVSAVRKLAKDWKYDVVSIGYPGPVLQGKPVLEPHNLGPGWVGFDFENAFQRPVKVINDAAMQALGSYKGGRSLFLGLGTGLGSAFIVDGFIQPLELGHLPYKKATFEDYVGLRGLQKHGIKKWRRHVADVVARLTAALEPEEVVLGGGNAKKLKGPPPGVRFGDNANAFLGGFRLWNGRRGQEHPTNRKEQIRGSAHRTAQPKRRRQRPGMESAGSPQ
jgi:polyphosphate glucokinase